MIGRRGAGRGPPANAVVKAAFKVAAILVEVNELRIALLHPASVYALGGDVEFTRNPDPQPGQSLYPLRKCRHRTFFIAKVQSVRVDKPEQSSILRLFDPLL